MQNNNSIVILLGLCSLISTLMAQNDSQEDDQTLEIAKPPAKRWTSKRRSMAASDEFGHWDTVNF